MAPIRKSVQEATYGTSCTSAGESLYVPVSSFGGRERVQYAHCRLARDVAPEAFVGAYGAFRRVRAGGTQPPFADYVVDNAV